MKLMYLKLILGARLCSIVSGETSVFVEEGATQTAQVDCGPYGGGYGGSDGNYRIIRGSCSECRHKCSVYGGDCAGKATCSFTINGACQNGWNCAYKDPYVEFKKDDDFDIYDNDHWEEGNTACTVPWETVASSKDHMKNTFGCKNDNSKSLRICHAKANDKITIFDKDNHDKETGNRSYLEITVKVDLRGRCATVRNFNEADNDTNELSYNRFKKGNGKLNNKISSFIICTKSDANSGLDCSRFGQPSCENVNDYTCQTKCLFWSEDVEGNVFESECTKP